MKVINRQTFSIAKHLESGREAAVQTDRSGRSRRVHVCVQTEQKGQKTTQMQQLTLKSCKSPRKVHMGLSGLMKSSEFHSDVPGRVLSSLSQHSKLPVCPPFSFLSSAAFT